MADRSIGRGGADGRSGGSSPVVSLSAMMFLQYAVWGVWLPYLASYLGAPVERGGLGFTSGQIGWILGLAGSIGAVTAPFVAGQIADRMLNAEKALGILLILGGIVKFATAYAQTYEVFLLLSIVYSVCYMPTLSLTNSVAFAHLDDPERRFPRVRTWGTIGWIVASSVFPLVWLQQNIQVVWYPPFAVGEQKADATALIVDCLRVSGVVAVLYGLWAMFVLPKTPPSRDMRRPIAFGAAFGLLRDRGFATVLVVALPISMIHQVYFMRTSPYLESLGFGTQYTGPIMSIGQFSEIAVLAVLVVFIKRLGYRWTLAVGAGAFAVRYALFALASTQGEVPTDPTVLGWMAVGAMVLHGLCYGCFFAAAFIYVERLAPADIRHSAQTVFGIMILGVGPVFAAVYNGWLDTVGRPLTEGGPTNYGPIWWTQAGVGLLATVAVALLFRSGVSGRQGLTAAAARAEADVSTEPM